MGGLYASGSATTRQIDFANTGTGANEALDTTDLLAAGWTVAAAGQLEKFFPDDNGTSRRWRILHNT